MSCVRSRNLLVCYLRRSSVSASTTVDRAVPRSGASSSSLNLTTKRVLRDPSPPQGTRRPVIEDVADIVAAAAC